MVALVALAGSGVCLILIVASGGVEHGVCGVGVMMISDVLVYTMAQVRDCRKTPDGWSNGKHTILQYLA